MKMFSTKCENKASDLLLSQENLRKGTIHRKMLYLFAPNFLLVKELGLFVISWWKPFTAHCALASLKLHR